MKLFTNHWQNNPLFGDFIWLARPGNVASCVDKGEEMTIFVSLLNRSRGGSKADFSTIGMKF